MPKKTSKIKPEYKKMLNNLLGIGAGDNAVLASRRATNIDLTPIVNESDALKLHSKPSFSVDIINTTRDPIHTGLLKAKTADRFFDVLSSYGLFLSVKKRKALQKNFSASQEEIANSFKDNKNATVQKWKFLKNTYLDKQSQTNSWPLYIGTMYMQIKIGTTSISAPLIMKKAMIEITKIGKIHVKTIEDTVDINQKLLYFLKKEFDLQLPEIDEFAPMSLDEAYKLYAPSFKNIIEESDIDLYQPYEYKGKAKITNADLKLVPGITLMLVQPSGGKLRDALIDMIDNDAIDDLLKIKDANIKQEVEDDLEKGKGVFRITETDFSQEIAIHGSLKDSALIWGPPGTGKSQTISNIIANLLYDKKEFLITSEKKAALDVLQARMGKLSKFIFFGLADKDADKKHFYKPFKDLIDLLTLEVEYPEEKPHSLLSKEMFEYAKQKKNLANADPSSLKEMGEMISGKHAWIAKDLDEYHRLVQNNLQFVEDLIEGAKPKDAIKDNFGAKAGLFGSAPKDAKDIIKLLNRLKGNTTVLEVLSKIKDITNIAEQSRLLKIENHFRTNLPIFEGDEKFLEAVLIERFKAKFSAMLASKQHGELTKEFIVQVNRAFRLPYKFINMFRDIINELFSVFVSTPASLASVIDMKKRYDYTIFDEASQMHLEKALPFLYISDRAIIAGDSEQMRPSNFFGVRDLTEIDESVAENAASLLDYAHKKGLKPAREYMLNKNYRSSSADLMLFSSKEFYNNELHTIDDIDKIGNSAITVYDVDGVWEGRVNEVEARRALDIVIKQEKMHESIIILTFNSTQKLYIESLIYKEKEYASISELLTSGKLKLRNLENIQGDEADLVIISIAYDKKASISATYVARDEGRNALNVAISRARHKMIVLKSIDSTEIKGTYKSKSILTFIKWLEYLEMPNELRRRIAFAKPKDGVTQRKFSSAFERQVFEYLDENLSLSDKTYLMTGYKIGSYTLGIAIVNKADKKFIAGIQISGYENGAKFSNLLTELSQRMFIEAKQYPIFNITELHWKADPWKVKIDLKWFVKN